MDAVTGNGWDSTSAAPKPKPKPKPKPAPKPKIVRSSNSVARPTGALSVASGAQTSGFVSKFGTQGGAQSRLSGGTSAFPSGSKSSAPVPNFSREEPANAKGKSSMTNKIADKAMKAREKVGNKFFDRGLAFFEAAG